MDISVTLTPRQAIMVVHALLAANIKTQALVQLLDEDESQADLARNITDRREVVDQIDAALHRKAVA